MSAFLSTKMDKTTAVHWYAVVKISFPYPEELPEMVVSIDSPRKMPLRFAWGQNTSIPSNEWSSKTKISRGSDPSASVGHHASRFQLPLRISGHFNHMVVT